MFKNKDEAMFYVLAGLVLVLGMWALNLSSLKSYPLAIPLLFAAFFANPLLVYIGKEIVGEESGRMIGAIVTICIALAFILVWAANPQKNVLGSVALPVALMFILPGVLGYVRSSIYRGGSDVQPQ